MATYRIVEAADLFIRARWTIERIVSGERPEELPFRGTRAATRAEVLRLYERDRTAPPMKDPTP